ncbi:hypothetical protein DFH09DRAFT_1364480 [Mycena vulgaris]|nr:hypothetical protein DFH09DRAFT_1364480 [Mycena vulgaris]
MSKKAKATAKVASAEAHENEEKPVKRPRGRPKKVKEPEPAPPALLEEATFVVADVGLQKHSGAFGATYEDGWLK